MAGVRGWANRLRAVFVLKDRGPESPEAAAIDEAFLAEDCLHDWLAGPKKLFFNQPQMGS
jgi:hypothetical protein